MLGCKNGIVLKRFYCSVEITSKISNGSLGPARAVGLASGIRICG
jgi:hypothetical protein